MALDMTRKISFKPTSRRSSHVRTARDRLARHWTRDCAPQSICPGDTGFRHPQVQQLASCGGTGTSSLSVRCRAPGPALACPGGTSFRHSQRRPQPGAAAPGSGSLSSTSRWTASARPNRSALVPMAAACSARVSSSLSTADRSAGSRASRMSVGYSLICPSRIMAPVTLRGPVYHSSAWSSSLVAYRKNGLTLPWRHAWCSG